MYTRVPTIEATEKFMDQSLLDDTQIEKDLISGNGNCKGKKPVETNVSVGRWLGPAVVRISRVGKDSVCEDPTSDFILEREIKEALLTLSEKEREVLNLVLFEEASSNEIASQFSITRREVYRIKKSAFQKIRRVICNKSACAHCVHPRCTKPLVS